MATPFVETVPNYEIIDGNMRIWTDDWSCCMSLCTFEKGMARAARVILAYRAERGGPVANLEVSGGHAARS